MLTRTMTAIAAPAMIRTERYSSTRIRLLGTKTCRRTNAARLLRAAAGTSFSKGTPSTTGGPPLYTTKARWDPYLRQAGSIDAFSCCERQRSEPNPMRPCTRSANPRDVGTTSGANISMAPIRAAGGRAGVRTGAPRDFRA